MVAPGLIEPDAPVASGKAVGFPGEEHDSSTVVNLNNEVVGAARRQGPGLIQDRIPIDGSGTSNKINLAGQSTLPAQNCGQADIIGQSQ